MSQNFSDSFAKAAKTLMMMQPFYGIFLMMLNKKSDSKIPTLCVGLQGLNYDLRINPDFWMSLNENVQLGALHHECMHMTNFHLTDFNHLTNKEILNIAMDIEINQYIPAINRGEDWMLPELFPELNLEPFKGTIYYYEKLMQAKEQMDKDIQAILQAIANGESTCELPSSGKTVRIIKHDWEEAEKLNEGAVRILKAQTEKIIRDAAEQVTKSRGTLPHEIEEILKRLSQVEPPKFDWKGYIRRFIGCSTRVYSHKTRRRPNLRFDDQPGMVSRLHKHVLLAIDTSGSVSKKELEEFHNEMYHIQKNGTTITVIQADAAVSHIGPFNPKEDFSVYGRGGTDFQPVIDYYNENLRKYSCLIYMTDGEAPNPDDVKGNVLWVLSSTSQQTDHLTGKTIQLQCQS
jgi:predicted metal-dependent peptidase